LTEGDEVVAVRATNGEQDLMMFSRMGQGIRFSEEDARPMARDTQGVRGLKLRPGDEVVSATVAAADQDLLLLTSGGYGKRTLAGEFTRQNRGGLGVKAMKLTRVRGNLVEAIAVRPGDEIVATSTDGILIRQGVDAISRQKRDSTGVKVMNLADGAELSAVTLVQTEEGDE
jgi:DNA gyrase subunit A